MDDEVDEDGALFDGDEEEQEAYDDDAAAAQRAARACGKDQDALDVAAFRMASQRRAVPHGAPLPPPPHGAALQPQQPQQPEQPQQPQPPPPAAPGEDPKFTTMAQLMAMKSEQDAQAESLGANVPPPR